MPVIHILGQILPPPPLVIVSLVGLPKIYYKPVGSDFEVYITINISQSQIDMECELDKFDDDCVGPLVKITVDLARAVVNLAAFANGFGLTTYIHTLVRPDGTPVVLLPHNPDLESVCTAFSITQPPSKGGGLDKIMSLVLTEPPLFMALDKLVDSQSSPHSIPVNCSIAVEGIRHMISPTAGGKGKRDDSWDIMRNALQIDRSYIELITHNSKAGRHGDRSFIKADVTLEIQKRAWTIMNRFLEFRKRNNQPLPLDEFPRLSA